MSVFLILSRNQINTILCSRFNLALQILWYTSMLHTLDDLWPCITNKALYIVHIFASYEFQNVRTSWKKKKKKILVPLDLFTMLQGYNLNCCQILLMLSCVCTLCCESMNIQKPNCYSILIAFVILYSCLLRKKTAWNRAREKIQRRI